MVKGFKLLIVFMLLACTLCNVFSQSSATLSATELLTLVDNKQKEEQLKIEAAFTAMDAVRKAGAYIESLKDLFGNGELTLPVGIKKGEYELIIQKIQYDEVNRKSQIYATCAFQFKENGQKIAFGGYVTIEGQKGIGTTGSLELIAPVRRNLGNKVAIVFENGTKVNFGCEGIESFMAKLSLIITSDKIIAIDNKGKPTTDPVTFSAQAQFQNFENFTISLNIDKSFCFKGLQDIVFNIKGITLDQSDTETSSMVKFPKNYFTSPDKDLDIKLWKGLALTNASIYLPAIFKNPDSTAVPNKRIELGLKNVIIDENGFTGEAIAENVIASQTIDKNKWDISLNDFSLNFFKNDLSGFGFGGEINIPPLGKNSLLPYKAKYNSSTESYDFVMNIAGNFDFPVLRSTLMLNPNSTIEILIKDSEIFPTLNACGKISVNAPINESDSTKKFAVPDITFENLKISRDEPYVSIGSIGVTGELKSPKIAGFELSISDIKSFKNDKGKGLAFVAGIKLNDMFGGEAGLQLYGDYAHWKFDHVGLDKINVDFKSSAYSLKGGVWFKNGDAVYGSGFRGDLAFTLIDKFTLDAVAVFGKKDDFRYFLTDVYLELTPTTGIPLPPCLTFYGFGGGIYKKMKQSYNPDIKSEFGQSLSGIQYIPDNTVGMGFMATTKFGLLSSPTAFNAKVGFEMQFNDHGGLNFIQLRGDAAIMDMPEKFGKLTDNIKSGMKKLDAAGGKLKLASKSDLTIPENKSSGFLTASMNIKYDLTNHVFSADLSAYLNAGIIKGIGPNDRLGWASAYFSPDKWYTYLGTPSDRVGVNILGLSKMDGYFMIGDEIPELPPPPQKVLQNFSQEKQDKLNKRNTDNLASGSGIAFGQSMDISLKATLPPFYASIGCGMGAEFLLKNYGEDAYCSGGSSTIGINGWYARAQAWAWVEADIGMEAKLFGKRKKFSILDLSASALLAGSGPNPFYFTGAVGGKFSVMGGLISGHCNFDFEMGEECVVKSGSPFGDDIIAQLTPTEGEKDVNVFASPQAVLNIPVGVEMEIEEDEGDKAWYKVTMENYSVFYKDTKQKVDGIVQTSNDGTILLFNPTDPFESKREMIAYVKVGFQRKLNNNWIAVKGSDGQPIYEEKTVGFISGDRPKEILPEHVKYSYPIAKQYNFYPKEYDKGYLMVTKNYSYLFSTDKPEGFRQIIRISDSDGIGQELPFTYITYDAGNSIRLEIDFSIDKIKINNDKIFKMAIVNVPLNNSVAINSNISTSSSQMESQQNVSITKLQAEGTLNMLEEKVIYSLDFRASTYNTFKEKMATFDTKGTGWRDYVEPFIHNIKANITNNEFFDQNEIQWLNGDLPVVQFEAEVNNTAWYKNSIYKNMFANFDLNVIKAKRNEVDVKLNGYGFPAVKAISIENREDNKILTEDEIKTGVPIGIYPNGIFTYSLPYWCSRDFFLIKNQIAIKVTQNKPLSSTESDILKTDFPPTVVKGSYPVKVNYVLPGKNIVTTTVEIEMYNPID